MATALTHGSRLADLARAILTRPEAGWWFEPLNRAAQLWVPWIAPKGERPDSARLVTPTGPLSSWERYAQKPEAGLFTSTAVDGANSALAALTHGAGDHHTVPPIPRYHLQASTEVRIFEVNSPDAWYRLCAGYPAAGEDGRLVPDWTAVARDWDGVHLTLGGLLTAEQVRVEGAEGWTELWGWGAELTAWLRWRFGAVERLSDLPGSLPAPVPLVPPAALWLEPGQATLPRKAT